jgi:hypothetical protein
MQAYIRPWVTVLFGWFRRRRDLVLENAALRQQLDAASPTPSFAGQPADHLTASHRNRRFRAFSRMLRRRTT